MTYEMEMALEYGVALEELLEMAGVTPEEWREE